MTIANLNELSHLESFSIISKGTSFMLSQGPSITYTKALSQLSFIRTRNNLTLINFIGAITTTIELLNSV